MKQIIYLLLLSLLLNSCSGTKPLIKPRELKNEDADVLLKTLYDYYGDYGSFTSKFSAEIISSKKTEDKEEGNDKAIEFKGGVRIKKDSVIWISISPLMVEMLRCKFTPDSVYFINKIEKTYYAGTYSIINEMIGFEVNFKTIQSILLNELCMYPFAEDIDTLTEIKSYDIKRKNNEILLQNKMKKKSIKQGIEYVFHQNYRIDTDYLRISGIEINELSKGYILNIDYKDFEQFDSIVFPEEIQFFVKSKSAKLKLNLEYSKEEFNRKQNYPFIISSRYTKWNKN